MMATMMRNLVLIGAILLVSASASVCECWRTKNPVSVLNKYLVENVVEDDFVDNMEAIDEYKPGQKGKQVEQLASLLSKLDRTLDPKNLCSESNLKTLRDTFEAVHSYDKESFKEPKLKMRLNRLLYNYFDEAWDVCDLFYAEKWTETHDRLVKLGLGAYIWTVVDGITRHHAFKFHTSTGDYYAFRGAIRLSQGKWKPSREELKKKLSNEERLSFDDAKETVSSLLYEPCEILLNDAEAQTILGPVTDLGTAMFLSGRPNLIWTSLEWAGRNIFCKWVIGKGEDQLAKMIL